MASSPKSPIIAEVSPAYRRWSEATASIDTSASSGKKNNEWSSNFERSYMEMEGKWNYLLKDFYFLGMHQKWFSSMIFKKTWMDYFKSIGEI